MELRDALRALRSEIGLTQAEFAAAINVGYSAESRWENQNTRPNRASSAAILALAKRRCVSAVCLDALTGILLAPRVDDKREKALAEEVTERMKVERREFLAGEQLKAVIDNLDLAVIGHRIDFASQDNAVVFYHNKRYAEIFGYGEAEFEQKSSENIYFGIPSEDHAKYLTLLRRLLSGKVKLADFSIVLSGYKKSGDMMWLEVKGISLQQFSFGYELFISCRDVTQRVEAERRYAEEVAVRDASIQVAYASMHCDLSANAVLRSRDLDKVMSDDFAAKAMDDVFAQLADAVPGGLGREALLGKLCRRFLLETYEKGEVLGSVRVFSAITRRWMRVEYVLIKNPYTEHVEAAVYIYDIQAQVYAEKMMHIIATHLFEYIGLIDPETGVLETFYCDSKVFRNTVTGKRDYDTACQEKLRLYADPRDAEPQRDAVSLPTIRERLQQSVFYSTVLKLKDYEGNTRLKRIAYTFLDEAKAMIVMAQSDRENIEKVLIGNGAAADDQPKEKRKLR